MKIHTWTRFQYLFVGPQYKKSDAEIGGTTVSFDLLCEYAKAKGKSISVIRTNRYQKKYFNFLNFSWVVYFALLRIPRCELVFLNVSPNGMYYLSPVLFAWTRLWNKKLAIRIFGGNEERILVSGSRAKVFIFNTIVAKADILLLQTKTLVALFAHKVKRVAWLPTSRKIPANVKPRTGYSKKCVYISQIHQAKGIDLIRSLIEILPHEYTLDVYGPILDENYHQLKSESFYKGVLEPSQVSDVLRKYDLLLLPTHHPGEGYPGIIIEALSLGMPVICSNWLSLPELIENGQNGFLIDSRDPGDWKNSILNLTETAYVALSQNALQSAGQFDWNKVNETLFENLDALCKEPN